MDARDGGGPGGAGGLTEPAASGVEIRTLGPDEAGARIGAMADVLMDAVEGGASVGFMAGVTRAEAEGFWAGVVESVRAGRTILVAAFAGPEQGGALIGTACCVLAAMPNQPHRADVAKVLVARAARGRGVATRLMRAVEAAARGAGRTLLTLDTCLGSDAYRLYGRLGYREAGIVPGYALYPDGGLCSTVIFYKEIAA